MGPLRLLRLFVRQDLTQRYAGNVIEKLWSLSALVAAGGVVFFAVAYVTGALDKNLIAQLGRRRPAKEEPVDLSE